MGSTRRSFTEEYKAKAVTFVMDDHRSIAEVARNIDGVRLFWRDLRRLWEWRRRGSGIRGRGVVLG